MAGEELGTPGARRCPRCGASFGPELTRCPTDGTSLVSVALDDPLLGLEVDGRYTLRAPLGQGGMGRVYRAYQHSIGRDVAFKVMNAGAQDEASRRRFMREAQLLGQLNHPGIVAAVDFGQLPDRSLYLVMELLEGQSLSQLVRSEGALSEERVVEIGKQICDALGAAHHRGIVHRDLKPSNVVRLAGPPGSRDVVKVLDFGLARPMNDVEHLTESGVVLGSAQFMAPELFDGAEAKPASDLYSLGAILYVLANGRLPFGAGQGFTAAAQRQAVGQLEPFAPTVSRSLEQVVRRLLSADPSRRPASAELVRELLTAVLELPPTAPSRPPHSRRPLVLSVAGALLVGLLATVAVSQWPRASTATPPAVSPPPPERVVANPEPGPPPPLVEPPPSATPTLPTEVRDAGPLKVTKRVNVKKRAAGEKADAGLVGEWLP